MDTVPRNLCMNGCLKEFEDTKGVIRIRISKNRQYNDLKKKDKRTNNDLQNKHIKLCKYFKKNTFPRYQPYCFKKNVSKKHRYFSSFFFGFFGLMSHGTAITWKILVYTSREKNVIVNTLSWQIGIKTNMATILTNDISFHTFKTNTSQIDTFIYGTFNNC